MVKPQRPLHGLIPAAFTPFHSDGSLNLKVIELQAEGFLRHQIEVIFIGGTTGECHSLTLEERRSLAQKWFEVTRGTPVKLVVHVGANCLADARQLASQAEGLGALAISAVAPCYFKPATLDSLIACCAEIAAAAPSTPFYYYDIPVLTGVNFPMVDFLAEAPARIPTLVGIKFSNPDLMSYQLALRTNGARWDIPFGVDQQLLGALSVGARGAVGSGYNFAAPIYQRLLAAFAVGDLPAARVEQLRGVEIVRLLGEYGYLAAAKALMNMMGIPVGPPRLPLTPLKPERFQKLERDLHTVGFFDWVKGSG